MAFGRRWVAAAALVLLAGGCSDDEPDPEFQPPSESSAPTSPTDSPSSSPSRQPWERKTEAGAVAFAKHWVDVFNEAQTTGDTKAMLALSANACRSCKGFAGQLTKLYSSGGHLESDGWRIMKAVATGGSSPDTQLVSLRIRRSPQVIHPGDGDAPERFSGGLATFSGHLEWTNGWTMRELELLE